MTMATNGIDRDYDVDHILPKSLGGTFAMSNLQLTHKRCNRAKGNLMPL
jgi:5-methylcytosine-specific restriction endonuclease McrA